MARRISTSRTGNSGAVKDGIYEVEILDAVEKTAQSGNDMIELRMAIVRNGKVSGSSIWDYLIFNDEDPDKTQWKFDQLHDSMEVEEGLEITASWYKGRRAYASLITDTYNGRVSNKVKAYVIPEVAQKVIAQQNAAGQEAGIDTDAAANRQQAAQRGRGRPAKQAQTVADMEEDTMPL
jgi:hypothetical protein